MILESSLATSSIPWMDLADTPLDTGGDSLTDWVEGLRKGGVRQAAPALILALDQLRVADLSPSRRIATLRLLKAPILKTCAGLPKPWKTAAKGRLLQAPTLEQRLFRSMFQNLKQALHQLDRCYFLLNARQSRRREWVVRNLLRFVERQLRYAALWSAPVPEGTWRDLHDLHVYLMVRRSPAPKDAPDTPGDRRDVDPELEYKQFLLFGLAAACAGREVLNGELMDRLPHWAVDTLLEDPHGAHGDTDVLVVELSEDSPPRRHLGTLSTEFRGWILIPPAEFLARIEPQGQSRPEAPGVRPFVV